MSLTRIAGGSIGRCEEMVVLALSTLDPMVGLDRYERHEPEPCTEGCGVRAPVHHPPWQGG